MTEAPHQPIDNEGLTDVPTRARRWLVPLIITVGVVALVTVALARGQTTFDPTTPEGAVQEYLQAIVDGRWEAAFEVLDPEAFAGCQPHHISNQVWSDFTAIHEGTTYGPTFAFVNVRLEFGDGGIWGGGGGWSVQFTLYEDRNWYITDDPWPHFRYTCGRF